MIVRTDPFRDFDRLTRQLFDNVTRPAAMPMDAFRTGDDFVVHFDLPGVDPEKVDVEVERNVLTVRAERRFTAPEDAETVVTERPTGTVSRQLFLGDSLDTERIDASYDAGVLTLRIPVAEEAKPKRIRIAGGPAKKEIAS